MNTSQTQRSEKPDWFDAWKKRRFAGLYDHAKSGRPLKLTEAEQEQAQQYIAQHPQNMKKVVHLLEQETSKRVSTKTIKRLLKKSLCLETDQARTREGTRSCAI